MYIRRSTRLDLSSILFIAPFLYLTGSGTTWNSASIQYAELHVSIAESPRSPVGCFAHKIRLVAIKKLWVCHHDLFQGKESTIESASCTKKEVWCCQIAGGCTPQQGSQGTTTAKECWCQHNRLLWPRQCTQFSPAERLLHRGPAVLQASQRSQSISLY
jgi:hypothetical protein